MNSQISRRRFLKLLSLMSAAPLLNQGLRVAEGMSKVTEGQDSPNVLIVLFDTLSARNMSLYGYPRNTTPHLTQFAQRATVYHSHHSGGNFTPPGTASLLTGTYPWTNRAFHHAGTIAEDIIEGNLFSLFAGGNYNRLAYTDNLWVTLQLNQFREEIDDYVDPGEFCLYDGQLYDRVFPNDENTAYQSFPELIVQAGDHQTGSLFLGLADKARMLAHEEILNRGYKDLYPEGLRDNNKHLCYLEAAIDGIVSLMHESPTPMFGYFHLYPPHAPYTPRREFVGMFDDGWEPVAKEPHFFSHGHSDERLNEERRRYDEYIANVDAEFGRLYSSLADAGLLDNTYLLVTSDHGEMFERGILRHSTKTLFEPIIHVPLLIAKPGQQQREDVYARTSAVDVLPTLAQITGETVPAWCEGELLPGFGQNDSGTGRSVFAMDARGNPKQGPLQRATVALTKDYHKLIHYFGYDGYESQYELYDLQNDPEEMEDLYLSDRSVAAELQAELDEKLQNVNQAYVRS